MIGPSYLVETGASVSWGRNNNIMISRIYNILVYVSLFTRHQIDIGSNLLDGRELTKEIGPQLASFKPSRRRSHDITRSLQNKHKFIEYIVKKSS